jgi:hypothetical protein
MPTGWLTRIGIFALVGGLCLVTYILWAPSRTTHLATEEFLAEVIQNLNKNFPASERFVLLSAFNEEAVLDKKTGLLWEKSPEQTAVTWNEARTICSRRTIGGQKGWRLPSPSEMRSLVGPSVDAPGPNLPPGHPFLNVQSSSYWTVVPAANLPSYAQYLDAFLGNVLSLVRIYTFPVWCVRGPLTAEDY